MARAITVVILIQTIFLLSVFAEILVTTNGGPGNAARWYETAGSDLDLFVDTIDFWETKSYVERIYAGYDIYSHLYGPQ